MNGAKEFRGLIRALDDDGRFAVVDRGSHWQVRQNRGDGMCVVHKTQSDRRGFKNCVAQLRKLGFEWKGR